MDGFFLLEKFSVGHVKSRLQENLLVPASLSWQGRGLWSWSRDSDMLVARQNKKCLQHRRKRVFSLPLFSYLLSHRILLVIYKEKSYSPIQSLRFEGNKQSWVYLSVAFIFSLIFFSSSQPTAPSSQFPPPKNGRKLKNEREATNTWESPLPIQNPGRTYTPAQWPDITLPVPH